MDILDFLDIKSIFDKVKKNHLEQFPTAQDYMTHLSYDDENFNEIEEMYRALNYPLDSYKIANSENYCDNEMIDLIERKMDIEFLYSGGHAHEGGDDYWCYGFMFKIDLDDELFIGFSEENYS